MKSIKYFLFLSLTLFVSCINQPVKTMQADTIAKSFQSTAPTIQATEYGLMYAASLSTDDAIYVANELGAKVIRMGYSIDQWTGKAAAFNAYTAAGLNVYLNINWMSIRDDNGVRIPRPYAKSLSDLNNYSIKSREILTTCRPKIVVCENEEMADIFHSGTKEEYLTQLQALVQVAHSMGIEVTNGGLTNPGLQGAVYRDLIADKRTADAQYFYDNCMDYRIRKAAANSGFNKTLDAKFSECDYLVEGYKKLGLDYINFHWYEPTAFGAIGNKTCGGLKYVAQYLRKRSGGIRLMSNECGVTNNSNSLVTSLLTDMRDNKIYKVIYFSAISDNGTTEPLNDGTNINALGAAYKDFIK